LSIQSLVLLSGPVAVGKTSVRNSLVDAYGFQYVRSSAYLSGLLSKQSLHDTRLSLQDLGDELDHRTDYRWVLDEVARPGIDALPQQKLWLIDAVRKARQIEHFREAFGSSIIHVHLTADEAVLSQRYASRLTPTGDTTSYATAIQHDNEIASRGLMALADLVVDTGVQSPEEVARKIVSALAERAQRKC